MAHQSPMISIPKKTTEEVDWTTPIRTLIAQSYGENPDNYAAECASLQRCRQDAVRGAGSDMTARDLLYKYFGQLELLELRFSEIRVTFPWHDAFTQKLTTQTSIAFEKASILFQIASTHSAIAASQARGSPEGLKRAFYYFRSCAGMLTYINENFLHAPSTDLSRDVVKFTIGIILAQATEIFWEKCVGEKKGSTLVSKIAAQTAAMYTTLGEEVKEFAGKGIFDRNWVTLLQIKSKHFGSVAQYHRAIADTDGGHHGEALVRLTIAENLAKEAHRLASSFSPSPGSPFPNSTATLPADAGPCIQGLTKTHLALCSERRTSLDRENDLIYNAVLPAQDALPPIESKTTMNVATPIPIQEVYTTPSVQQTIGPDIFIRLVPLSVHESASVYSEEKAKLVRGEVERADTAESEAKSFLDGLNVVKSLGRFRAIAEDDSGSGDGEIVSEEVRAWAHEISGLEEGGESVPLLLGRLETLKAALAVELLSDRSILQEMDRESRACEAMRVKHGHLWTQEPSAGVERGKELRSEAKALKVAMEEAAASDEMVTRLWQGVNGDVGVLVAFARGRSKALDEVFRNGERGQEQGSLLDFGEEREQEERNERDRIRAFVTQIDERLGVLRGIERERGEIVKELKEKIQSDDVSHILLLNRRNTGVEPTLFAAELEKFKPYQARLAANINGQQAVIHEISGFWKSLKDFTDKGRCGIARRWEDKERTRRDGVRRFSAAREGYGEVRDGLAKGLQFYSELTDLTTKLRRNVKAFVGARDAEREALASKLEREKLASAPPPPAKPPKSNLEDGFQRMSLGSPAASQWGQTQQSYQSPSYSSPPPPPPPQQQQQQYTSPASRQGYPPPPSSQYNTSSPQPYGTSSSYNYSPSAPPQGPARQMSFPPPPPQPAQSSYPPPSQQPQYSSSPPPPPPASNPYASLGMFDSRSSAPPQSQTQTPSGTSSAYTPSYSLSPQQQQTSPYPQQGQSQGAYSYPYQERNAGPPQSQPQQVPGQFFPPPPPPVSYQTPPPPAQNGYPGQPHNHGW